MWVLVGCCGVVFGAGDLLVVLLASGLPLCGLN